ncbi:arylsulfatase [Conexibacter woesei]|uniref:Sulfatase n=1 Tax=Conexibacter woesei (strain DSM 14684 / CCUG 47730 / CIP 108061 / JCM 11494 / NBRC 100937 / ID131577) TaxID=469383 RepID=D3F7G7_CONWI|nr:arylsulfatase [Conexibacter woesei]ADB50829.1 sulfatase [Conexibacter woesei DSM 14684]
MPAEFRGSIRLDIRDSVPDWTPYLAEKAPAGAPNVLVILYDDTGTAAWSPYGGRIEMPTMQRFADEGLTYSQWHTTALCGPTRSCFLTGRNHHQNSFATIAETATGFPGNNTHIPMENAFMAEVLRERGWSTFWVGKNHNVPVDEFDQGSTKRNWPLGRGFDRFYGFIGGETNQWYPDLTEDNHYIDQPYRPEDGYHLSKDLADQAIAMIRDSQQSQPEKPWHMFYCPGANHAPHHAPQEFIDKYRGVFDDGYEAYREWVLPRMIEKGILPEGTELTPLNPLPDDVANPADAVRPWATLSSEERRLFARMAEAYAGFSEYTDHEIGRIVAYLEETGQLDNTLVFYAADNGASGEGSPNGSVNEGKFFNAWPDTVEDNLPMIDKLGSPDTYNHYPTGWAAAFSTPYKMFKRYSYQGGVCDPLVISWPAGIRARGEVRDQYHHCTDIVPTILECCGVEMPDTVLGYRQTPLAGVSMRYSFDDAAAPTQKPQQYYEMLGTRAMWKDGWKAVAEHAPMPSDRGHFDRDRWQLFHTDVDRSESSDLAAEHPERLRALVDLWFEEAEKYDVLPLSDLGILDYIRYEFQVPVPRGGTYVYGPAHAGLPEHSAASTHGVSYSLLGQIEVEDPGAQGVIFAQGSRFGGHALFLKDRRLHYVYNFIGIKPEQHYVSDVEVGTGGQVVGVEFVKERVGEHGESHGTVTMRLDEQVVATGPLRTQSGHFSLAGEGLCIGRDSGDAVSEQYRPDFPFEGGRIVKFEVGVGDDGYVDLERRLHAALARD